MLVGIRLMILLIALGLSEAATVRNNTKILHIMYFVNPPYIHKAKTGNITGELDYILNYSKNGPCKHIDFKIEYGESLTSYVDLLALVTKAPSMKSANKIYALAPFTDKDTIGHQNLKYFNTMVIAKTHGYTMITNKLTKNKIYRIVVFGLTDSLTLIVALIIFTMIAAASIWLLERRSQIVEPDFSYRFLPGFWDGIWWAFVTAVTVGYGDKTPKTFFGRLLGLIWLFVSCSLLSAYTAIMTGSITDDVGISEKKIGYLNGTTAEHYINEHTGIPIPAYTYEDAIRMTLEMEVYGTLLDTNYVTEIQDFMYASGIVVEKRLHSKEIESIFAITKSSLDENHTLYKCLKKEFDLHANTHKLKMKAKPKQQETLLQSIKPFDRGVGLTFTCMFAVASFLVLIGVSTEVVFLVRSFNSKRRVKRNIPVTPKHNETLPKLRESIQTIEEELSSVKRILAQIEGDVTPRIRSKPKISFYGPANGKHKFSVQENRM